MRWKGVYGGRNEDAAVGGSRRARRMMMAKCTLYYHNNPRQNLHVMSSISASNPLKNDADMISNVSSAG